MMKQEMVRLHVVGASDSGWDQAVKLRVRDAVLDSLAGEMAQLTEGEQAKEWIAAHLTDIARTANETLAESGSAATAVVTLEREEFPVRFYDTFSLPAGVYDSLRITIGEGAGRNWWCVVFPSLCVPETAEGFADVAVGAGFSTDLTAALTEEYEVRFFLLDLLGQVENFLHRG